MASRPGRIRKYVRDWQTFPGDVVLAYRNDGLSAAWEAFAQRFVYRLIRTGHMIVYAQKLEDGLDIMPPTGVAIRPLSDAELPALRGVVAQRDIDRFRGLLEAGRHGLIAWRGSQPIGYAWVAEQMGPDVTLCPFQLPPDAAYLWDLYVLPRERSGGIGSALASARIQKARELGFREGWRVIAPSNHASVRTLQRTTSATRVVGELRFVKIFSRMHVRFTPAAG